MPADPLITLVETVPEFAPWYLELVAQADDDPGLEVVLTAFGDFLAEAGPGDQALLVRAGRALEAVAEAVGDEEAAEELVGWSCLDGLDPAVVRRLRPHLGPRTRRVLAAITG